MATVTTSADTISVDGSLTIGNVSKLKEQLLKAMQSCQCCALDLSAVDNIDTAGFQILAMLKAHAETSGFSFSIVNHSTATRRIIKLLMATDEFSTNKEAVN